MPVNSKRLKTFLLPAAVFLLFCGILGCSLAKRSMDDGSNPPVNGRRMNDKMSDPQILEIFGIDPASSTSTVARGPDGSGQAGQHLRAQTKKGTQNVPFLV